MSLAVYSSSPTDALFHLRQLSVQLEQLTFSPEQLLRKHLDTLQQAQAKTVVDALKNFAFFLSENSLDGISGGLEIFKWLFPTPNFAMPGDPELKQVLGTAIKKQWKQSTANTWHHYFSQRNVIRESCEAYCEFLLEKVEDKAIVNGFHEQVCGLLVNAWEIRFARAIEGSSVNEFIQNELQRLQTDTSVLLFIKALRACLHLNTPILRLVERILSRYKQLIALPENHRLFSHVGAFRLAFFIEVSLPVLLCKDLVYFKKESYQLPRSIICESGGSIFILSKSKVKLLQEAGGSYKKYRTAIQLCPLIALPAQLIAHAVNLGEGEFYSAAVRELVFARELRGKRGIALFLGQQRHVKLLANSQTEKKVDTFWHLYDGNLQDVRNGSLSLDHRALCSIAEDIITGLYEMHKMGIIHGDLKLPNILHETVGRRVSAFITDFSLSFVFGQEDIPAVYKAGFYGSIWFTAPELFGQTDFRGDFFQVEVFALGVLLYQLYCLKEPPWITFLTDCEKQNAAISVQQIQQFHQMVHAHIEPAISREERAIKQTNKLLYLILRMLRVDPRVRITLDRALQEIQLINS